MKAHFLLSLIVALSPLMAQDLPLYQQSQVPIDQRVEDLLSRMTLEEKAQQLSQGRMGTRAKPNTDPNDIKGVSPLIGSVMYFAQTPFLRNLLQKKAIEETRLGIPVLFGFDVIHGFRTIYPIPLAQACSWNPELVAESAKIAAKETRRIGVEWIFSPMIDVARDGRWGRVAEGYGEDPYTTGVFAAATVQAYQGDDLTSSLNVASCLKHFTGYGASEGGRDYVYTEISDQSLWDTYLPPYEAAVNAGAATLMSAFNDISGVPATINRYLMTDVLKGMWKHDGFVISDWGAVSQLINQGVAADKKEATLKAFTAGVEMDMVSNCYVSYVPSLVEEGKIKMEQLDEAVRRILRLKFRLGIFENPYVREAIPEDDVISPEGRREVERLAEECIVLLKNKAEILPLSDEVKKIALIGPLANNQSDLLGCWPTHGRASDVCSILSAMQKEFKGKAEIAYAQGCGFDGSDTSQFAEALSLAAAADVVVLCLGEKKSWSGEGCCRSTLALPTIQENLLAALQATGKPIITILGNGRPLELPRIEKQSEAMVEMWAPGIAGGVAVAGVLSGRVNPSGKLAITFPYSSGQIPIYYNRRSPSRGGRSGCYQDITSAPLYEFGHGLSYSHFEYGELTLSSNRVRAGECLIAEIAVSNTSHRDGKETLHWFIHDPVCSISRPMKELKFFEKQEIKAGETKVFRFEIDTTRDFSYVNRYGEKFLEPGEFTIIVKDQQVKLIVE